MHAGICPRTYFTLLRSSLEWTSGSRSVRAVRVGGDGSGLPVRLVKVDVVGASPVCKHLLLRDEAVVASSPAPLVGEIHGALVGPRGLVVMIRHRGMGGGSTRRESRGEKRRVKHEKARKSKCEGEKWSDNYEKRAGGEESGSESQWGRKWWQPQRKTERSEECVLTDVFIIHHLIPLMAPVAARSVEDSATWESLQSAPNFSMNIQMCQTVLGAPKTTLAK